MHIFLRLLICACLRLLYAAPFLRTLILFLTVGFADTFPAQQRKIPVLWNFQQRNFERERQTFTKYPCFHAEFFYQPAAQNSIILEFPPAQFFNKARQNHAFASVTYKIRRADFSVRTERSEFSRLSLLRLNTYSARAQNMCSAHIFKLLIMFRTRNMCSAHIFKVAYMCLLALIICGAIIFFTDDCSFPNRWVCGRFSCTAAQNSGIMEFSITQF